MKSSRIYSSPQDLHSMIALLNLARNPGQLADYPNRVDLHELMQSSIVQANTRLWFEDEQLIADALVDEYNNIFFECLTGHLGQLGDEIIDWGTSRISGDANALDTNCRESDIAKIAFLEHHGFTRIPSETISMRRSLEGHIPMPVLPSGFIIRPVIGEEEADRLAELHRQAFGTNYVTTDVRLAWMRVPEYDPSLDLVAIAPNGTLAAYCMCSISHEQNQVSGNLEGQTDPIATHPRYQKLGLAKALLYTGMHLLKERGLKVANLGTSGDNITMQAAARSVGFHIDHKKIWFEKAINKK